MNSFEIITDLPKTSEFFVSDMEKRFNRTFLLYQSNKESPVEIVELRDHTDDYKFRIVSKTKDFEINIKTDMLSIVQPFLPKTGYYTLKKEPYYLYKSPQRQWKRSFCSSIYAANGPTMNYIDWGRLGSPYWSDIAHSILTSIYTPLDSVTSPTSPNIAINKSFACILDQQTKKRVLVYRRVTIGSLNFDTVQIEDVPPSIRQEVEDLLHRTHTKLWTIK